MKTGLIFSCLAGNAVFGQGWFSAIKTGATSQEFQSASPRCGRPRVHHQWNLFFELPDSRKRRSFETIEAEAEKTAAVRSYGTLDRRWFNKAKQAEETLTSKDTQRLVGGHEAVPGSWPWQVFLKLNGKTQSYDCGGSIIDSKWILTAAHCVPYRVIASRSYVLAGVHEVRSGAAGSKRYRVKRVITHEDYGVPILDNNDVALIELAEPLRFSETVQPICLPDTHACLPEGAKCAATGWGVTDKTGISAPPNALNEVGLKIIENNTCWNMHSDYQDQLSAQMVCAGYKEGGRDACLGDSGGPLACQVEENGPWMLYGVTSWGIGCGDPLHPGVYARVTALIDWITGISGVKASIFGADWGLACDSAPQVVETTGKPEQKTAISTSTAAPILTPATTTASQVSLNVQKQVEKDLLDFKHCGGKSDKLSGQLSIAKIGAEHPNGVTCRWTIEPASDENNWVEITFKRANIGNCKDKGFGNGVFLPNDYVLVLDANERVIRANICKASGKAPVKVYAQKSASVILHTTPMAANSKQGFKLRFESISYIPSRCGDRKFIELLPDQTHHITSMNWPAKYNSNAACEWEITAPLGHVVLAEVVDFWIGGSAADECSKSNVLIRDSGGEQLAKICGRFAENVLQYHSYTSSSRKMSVDFKSGTIAVKRGFRIRIRSVPVDSLKETRSLTTENVSTEVLVARMEKLLGILKGRLQSQQL